MGLISAFARGLAPMDGTHAVGAGDCSRPLRGTAVALAGLIVAGWLVVSSPWVYRNGIGEPDSLAMAVGTYQAMLSGRGLGEPSLYAPAGHPLYYGTLIGLGGWRRWTVDDVVTAMNVASWLATGLTLGVLYLLARHFVDPLGAFGATVALATSPLVLELGSYGHPVTVALLLFMIAAEMEVRWARAGEGTATRSAATFVGAFVLLLAALEIRADVGLMFPSLWALVAWASRGRWRPVAGSIAVTGASVLAYLVVGRLLTAGGVAHVDLLSFLTDNYSLGLWVRGTAKWLHVAGIGTMVALGLGVAYVLGRGEWRYLVAGGLMIGPTLAFYAGNPFPSRHFFHAIVGGCLLAILLWGRVMRGAGPWAAWTLVIAVGVVNMFSHVPLGIAAEVSARYVDVKGSWRLGESVWELHRRNETFQDWDRGRWTALLPTLPDGCLVVGDWMAMTNLMATMSRVEGRIAYDDRELKKQGLVRLTASGRSIDFAGWGPEMLGALTRPSAPGCPVVTLQLPEDTRRLFPTSTRVSVPPAGIGWVLF